MKLFITCVLVTYLTLDVGAAGSDDAHCTAQRLCDDDLNPKPICGYNGHGKYQKFDNECEMEIENCRIQVKKGYVFMYLPLEICSTKRAKRSILEDNPIKPKEIDESEYAHCKIPCVGPGIPVCGYNGHGKYLAFANECAMVTENCRCAVRREPVYTYLPMSVCNERAKN